MSKQGNGQAVPRRRHSVEFKVAALGLTERVGVARAAKQLGLHESQLYDWRKKARYETGRSELEKELAAEKARLKRQVAQQAEQAEELAILKKRPRRSLHRLEVKYAFLPDNASQRELLWQPVLHRGMSPRPSRRPRPTLLSCAAS